MIVTTEVRNAPEALRAQLIGSIWLPSVNTVSARMTTRQNMPPEARARPPRSGDAEPVQLTLGTTPGFVDTCGVVLLVATKKQFGPSTVAHQTGPHTGHPNLYRADSTPPASARRLVKLTPTEYETINRAALTVANDPESTKGGAVLFDNVDWGEHPQSVDGIVHRAQRSLD